MKVELGLTYFDLFNSKGFNKFQLGFVKKEMYERIYQATDLFII